MTSTPAAAHQRKSPRRALFVPCGVLHGGNYGLSRVHQIGEGGMLIECPLPLRVNDRVTVALKIPFGGYFCTTIEILNVAERDGIYWVGSTFVRLPMKVKRWIRAYVAAKTEQEVDMGDPNLSRLLKTS